jgi:hypothetical protein
MKIHRRFKFESVLKFIIQILLGIWSWPNRESCSKYSNISSYKHWVFLEEREASISISYFELILNIGKIFKPGGTHPSVPFGPPASAVQTATSADCCHPPFSHRPYPYACAQWRDLRFHFTSSQPLLCSAFALASLCSLQPPPAARLTTKHHWPPLTIAIQARQSSPTSSSTSSTPCKPEPNLLHCRPWPQGSPSPTTFGVSPASPPHHWALPRPCDALWLDLQR